MSGVAFQGGAVAFDEHHHTPAFTAGRESRSIQRSGRVAWGDLPSLFSEGFPAPPALFGVYPGISYLFCESMTARPFYEKGDAPPNSYAYSGGVLNHGGQSDSQRAEVDITYSLLDFDDNSGGGGGDTGADFLSWNTSIGVEFLSMQNSGLKWSVSGLPASGDGLTAHKRIPHINHNLTVHRAASLPFTAMRNCIGTICSDSILGAPAYSILYVGSQTRYGRNTLGQVSMSIDHQFAERRFKNGTVDVDWRYWLNPVTGVFEKLVLINGAPIYEEKTLANFQALFAV